MLIDEKIKELFLTHEIFINTGNWERLICINEDGTGYTDYQTDPVHLTNIDPSKVKVFEDVTNKLLKEYLFNPEYLMDKCPFELDHTDGVLNSISLVPDAE